MTPITTSSQVLPVSLNPQRLCTGGQFPRIYHQNDDWPSSHYYFKVVDPSENLIKIMNFSVFQGWCRDYIDHMESTAFAFWYRSLKCPSNTDYQNILGSAQQGQSGLTHGIGSLSTGNGCAQVNPDPHHHQVLSMLYSVNVWVILCLPLRM